MFELTPEPTMPTADTALPGRDVQMPIEGSHTVLGTPIVGPFPASTEQIVVGLGCFWGAERCFWQLDGVYTTAVGYAAGLTPNPSYQEVCSGLTGHNEVVLVVYHPDKISIDEVLGVFWESHDPTQGMAQGNDRGTQYRSGIYCSNVAQLTIAEASKKSYNMLLREAGHGAITTEIEIAGEFYYAEPYHQQYLDKNPNGYCGLGGTGVSCNIPLSA